MHSAIIKRLMEFVDEDIGIKDITTESTVPKKLTAEAVIVSNESGILAGLEEAKLLLERFKIKFSTELKDGDRVKKGSKIIKLHGNARKILSLERVLLNVLMRMSGIATAANMLAAKCKGVTIAGTRKTTPGFRYFEKKAIRIGGGHPHRFGLSDEILIKGNHVALVGLENAIKRAKEKNRKKKIEVEVSSLKNAVKACECGADIVMLDNMAPGEIAKTLAELKKRGLRKKVKIELSGGISPENIKKFARLKPEIISMGYLTTKSKWLDMSLKVRASQSPRMNKQLEESKK